LNPGSPGQEPDRREVGVAIAAVQGSGRPQAGFGFAHDGGDAGIEMAVCSPGVILFGVGASVGRGGCAAGE